ncbi:MAG: Gp49 family protein [Bacilli bacterium]|jgi:hypothetical protein
MDLDLVKEEFGRIGEKTTICCLTLKNGFEITGVSACVDAAEYSYEIGKGWAKKAALDKYEELCGFARQQTLYCGAASAEEE